MKITNLVVSVCAVVSLVGCATTKYKAFNNPANFKLAGKSVQGKTPKQAAQTIGQPMSVYFDENNVYHMVYPMSDQEVGMTDLMFNDRLECFDLRFEKEKSYKFDGWLSDVSFTCGAIKDKKLDTSLID